MFLILPLSLSPEEFLCIAACAHLLKPGANESERERVEEKERERACVCVLNTLRECRFYNVQCTPHPM